MTTTTVRRLNYRRFETRPVLNFDVSSWLDIVSWYIERLLDLSYDYQEPDLITGLAWINPDVRPEVFSREIGLLYVLADQIAEAGSLVASGDDDWEAPRATIVDEYESQLERVARLVRGAL